MYQSKCLFRNTNSSFGREPSAIESVWAYLHGIDTKKTGRYRIRITKMSATELIQMGLAPEETPPEFYGLQASLDKWHENNAWLPLFDWVGDPNAEIEDIERDLGKQFESFITGVSIHETFGFDLPKPPKPPKKPPKTKKYKVPDKSFKYPELKDIPDDKINDLPSSDDFDWL